MSTLEWVPLRPFGSSSPSVVVKIIVLSGRSCFASVSSLTTPSLYVCMLSLKTCIHSQYNRTDVHPDELYHDTQALDPVWNAMWQLLLAGLARGLLTIFTYGIKVLSLANPSVANTLLYIQCRLGA